MTELVTVDYWVALLGGRQPCGYMFRSPRTGRWLTISAIRDDGRADGTTTQLERAKELEELLIKAGLGEFTDYTSTKSAHGYSAPRDGTENYGYSEMCTAQVSLHKFIVFCDLLTECGRLLSAHGKMAQRRIYGDKITICIQ